MCSTNLIHVLKTLRRKSYFLISNFEIDFFYITVLAMKKRNEHENELRLCFCCVNIISYIRSIFKYFDLVLLALKFSSRIYQNIEEYIRLVPQSMT